jgi:hypothetical protein
VRFGNFFDGFEIVAAILEGEQLPATIWPHSLNGSSSCHKSDTTFRAEPESRRHAVLEHFQDHVTVIGRNPTRFVFVLVVTMAMAVPVAMPMMVAAAEQPRACDIDRKSKDSNGYRFGEMDRYRFKKTTDGFIADQQRDHRQDDGAAFVGSTGDVADAIAFIGANKTGILH